MLIHGTSQAPYMMIDIFLIYSEMTVRKDDKRTCAAAANISTNGQSVLHCVHFREKLEQKRFSAKLRIEPGTIRLPTVGCFNHSATGLVGK